jgi:hypothetical protein
MKASLGTLAKIGAPQWQLTYGREAFTPYRRSALKKV